MKINACALSRTSVIFSTNFFLYQLDEKSEKLSSLAFVKGNGPDLTVIYSILLTLNSLYKMSKPWDSEDLLPCLGVEIVGRSQFQQHNLIINPGGFSHIN